MLLPFTFYTMSNKNLIDPRTLEMLYSATIKLKVIFSNIWEERKG